MTLLQVFTEKVADVIADVEVGVKKSAGNSWTTTFSFSKRHVRQRFINLAYSLEEHDPRSAQVYCPFSNVFYEALMHLLN